MCAGIDEESQQRLIQSPNEAAPPQAAAGGTLTDMPDRRDSLQPSDDSDSASCAAEAPAIDTLDLADDRQRALSNGRSQGVTAEEDASLPEQPEDLDLYRDSAFWQSEDDAAPPPATSAAPQPDLVTLHSASLVH